MDGLTRKIFIGATVGIGVVASSAALYFLLRDDDEDPLLKEFRTETTRQTTVRVKIRKDAIGAVIGRGGETVKRIQKDTKTRINFEDDVDDEGSRFAVIKGSPETVAEAEKHITMIINDQPVLFTENIFIPHNAVGIIIGRGGKHSRLFNLPQLTSISFIKVKR